jgi:uncharacterized ferritin-like protein (DUF455 family)
MRSGDFQYGDSYRPFRATSGKPDSIRPMQSPEGVADRLRVVAFAELQARDLFFYGRERFAGRVPGGWERDWERFSRVEDRHAQLLLDRMARLGTDPGARAVSDKLSRLCRMAEDPVLFLFLLSGAEERGMEAGFTLEEQMRKIDAESAAIFGLIAKEEVEHVNSARAALLPYPAEELRNRARCLSAGLQAATIRA